MDLDITRLDIDYHTATIALTTTIRPRHLTTKYGRSLRFSSAACLGKKTCRVRRWVQGCAHCTYTAIQVLNGAISFGLFLFGGNLWTLERCSERMVDYAHSMAFVGGV